MDQDRKVENPKAEASTKGADASMEAITKCRQKGKKLTEFKRGDDWEIRPRETKNGRVDNYYYHKHTNKICRSVPEIERFELKCSNKSTTDDNVLETSKTEHATKKVPTRKRRTRTNYEVPINEKLALWGHSTLYISDSNSKADE